jgi:hypothetical protein
VIRGRVREVAPEALVFTGPRTLEALRRDQMYDQCWRPALRAAGLEDHRYRWHSNGSEMVIFEKTGDC